jgi:cytochrome b6-f complex iron-sulfur subunit
MDNSKTSRREFCAHAISFVTVASLIEGCGGGNSPTSPGGGGSNATTLSMINGSVSGRTVSVTIDAASPLASAGSAAFLQSTIGRFLVARTGQQSFSALTAVCTHEQCDVTTFSSSSSRFVCPCHGSQYTTSGAVANGPATRPLQSFPTTFTNDVLSFTV